LLKGPDFISRLHGFLNILGPNQKTGSKCPDITWPIRRALILRNILQLKDKDELDIDYGLLSALLGVSNYRHGARSFEKIVKALEHDRQDGRLHRSALLPQSLLERETDVDEFQAILIQRDAFKNHPDLESLAAAVHHSFLDAAKQAQLEAETKAAPHLAWTINPAIRKVYDDLAADAKAANRAAARRIPDHLALIGFVVEPQQPQDDGSWIAPLNDAIEMHIERLAQAEHLGWCAERSANGWTYSTKRDNELKHHPLLCAWTQLSENDRKKDRASVRSTPGLLQVARFKATPARPRALAARSRSGF